MPMNLLLIAIQVLQIPLSSKQFLDSGWNYHKKKDYAKAINFYKEGIEINSKSDFIKAQTLLNLANIMSDKGMLVNSNQRNIQSLTIFQTLGNHEKSFHCLRNIGVNYNGLGNYSESSKYLLSALEIALEIEDPKLIYLARVSLGKTNEEVNDFSQALEHYLNAYSIASRNNLKTEVRGILINIGNVHLSNEELDSAISYYRKSYLLAKEQKDSLRLGFASNNLGEVYLELGKPNLALKELKHALQLKKLHAPSKVTSTYNLMAEAHFLKKRFRQAEFYTDTAIYSAIKLNDFIELIKAYKTKMKLLVKKEAYKEAYEISTLLDSMKNLRFNEEKLKVNKQQSEYDLMKADEKLNDQLTINTNQRYINYIIITVAVVAMILLILFYRLYKSNYKLGKRNELLLKEQNHRVKNNLQMINSLLSLQSQKLLSTDAKDALNESQFRINSVALLHRMLYEGENLGEVNALEYLSSLTEEVRYAVHRSLKLDLHVTENLQLAIEKATSLGLIVNELMTNSIKHVGESTNLEILLTLKEENKGLMLTYSDNGEGISEEAWNNSQSFGNQLIRIQSEQLRGKYAIRNKKGFEYELKISA